RRHRPDAVGELHSRPLLTSPSRDRAILVLGGVCEIDPFHGPDTPLRVGLAARVAVHHRVVRYAATKRVVALPIDRLLARALLGFIGTPAGLFARLACGRRADLHRAAR